MRGGHRLHRPAPALGDRGLERGAAAAGGGLGEGDVRLSEEENEACDSTRRLRSNAT